MALYVWITLWFFMLLLAGLMPESTCVAECWPNQPEGKNARRYKLIISALAALSLMLLWFLTAFRSPEIGNDTKNYLSLFRLFSNGYDFSISTEIGYQTLNVLIAKFTKDQHLFLIAIATIMYGLTGLYIFKYSHNVAISLCLFFGWFFPTFVALLRQGLAMLIALYGYRFLKAGKKIPAAAFFLLATSFHISALVCFLLFLDFKILQKRWFVFTLTALCAVASRTDFLKTVINAILPKYTHYFESQYASSGWLAISYYLLLYFILYYLVSRSFIEDHRPDRLVAANFSLLLFFTAFGYAVNLFDRVGEYFLLIAITEFPNMLYRGKVKRYRLWILGICAISLAMFLLILVFRPGWYKLYPYEFWH